MKFWEFTKAIGKPLVGISLVMSMVILGVAAYLNRLGCLLKNPLNIELPISVILMIYFHELGHYIPLRNHDIRVQNSGFSAAISTSAPIPYSAILLSALLPLLIALIFTSISKNPIFIFLWLGIAAATLLDALEVV
ncbi:hypothetical protein ADU37_CDS06380 [Thermococcus sp. 2319x1]|uniref:hypothetical protein n=1 Tax=Thermococcus sp. 2319x1 TaxID=1674923 RepID=UPI00073AC6E1|nr:hypothetical protein [Thermococcus sp. 2319x1]ALV62337.1 hypothetical protein ADU37_CDS06380 [Thermococcus sp. 2319x1]